MGKNVLKAQRQALGAGTSRKDINLAFPGQIEVT